MKNMKISTRLALGFLVIIILSVFLAGVGIFSIISINDNNSYLIESPIEHEFILRDVMLQFTMMRYRAANYAMEFENPDIITNTLTPQFQQAYSLFTEKTNLYLSINENDDRISSEQRQKNKANAEKLQQLVAQFVPIVENVRSAALMGNGDLATVTLRNAISLASEINGLIGEMTKEASDWANLEINEMSKFADSRTVLQISITAVSVVFAILLALYIITAISNQVYWYQRILDSIPLPLSVTDMNRKTMLINKPVEDFLKIKQADAIGVPCSAVWKAGICNTENCGIECLGRNKPITFFSQAGMDFRVDTSYLLDRKNKKIGYIELVQDLTAMMKAQKAETELVKSIGEVSQTFVLSAKQIADGSDVLAQNSTEQAATAEQLSSSVAKVADKTTASAEMAEKAAKLAHTIKGKAENGSNQMDEMIKAVREINEASQSISKVLKVIDDIAFQTNILALNASVEAARAGQHGKGFAVVAEEVRSLASKSAEAANNTGAILENSIEKAKLGVRIAAETATSLTEIVSGINESNRLIVEIAKASEEQSEDILQIKSGIEQVTQIIQQTSATAEESAAASQEMSEQVNYLDTLLYQFKSKTEAN